MPFGGIIGDSVRIRLLEEFISDPDNPTYSLADLARYTASSPPAVKKELTKLLKQGFIKVTNKNTHRPTYQVDTKSKRFFILTLLSTAVLDDKNGTELTEYEMDNYSEFRGKEIFYETKEAISQGSSATSKEEAYQGIKTEIQKLLEQAMATKVAGVTSK